MSERSGFQVSLKANADENPCRDVSKVFKADVTA